MVQKVSNNELDVNKPAYMYYLMTKSGQCSPTSDTLDSGTGSDLETSPSNNSSSSSPSLTNAVSKSIRKFGDLSLQLPNGQQHRLQNRSTDSYNTDSEESESSLSCDSLNSNEILRLKCNGKGVAIVNMQPPATEAKSTTKTMINTSPFVIATRPHAAPPLPPTSPPPPPPSNDTDTNRHIFTSDENNITKINFLPHSLLRDIRDRSMSMAKTINAVAIETTAHQNDGDDDDDDDDDGDDNDDGVNKLANHTVIIKNTSNFSNWALNRCSSNSQTSECQQSVTATSTARAQATNNNHNHTNNGHNGNISASSVPSSTKTYENDKYYKFHINESVSEEAAIEARAQQAILREDDTFAGYKDISARVPTSTIRSSKGTIRGVKNRVRNGIATFLQMQQTNVKNYKEKDAGKVVLYSTSMGIVRETYAKCANVKQILRTLLIKFEERDVFMSNEYQQEIKHRMQSLEIQVPQLFVDGQYIGNAEQVERLNESGELRQMLKIYKSMNTSYTCQMCGGYRLLPCPSCSGSKKSVHRNHFTTEFVALKCMNCDEVGLVKCYNCN